MTRDYNQFLVRIEKTAMSLHKLFAKQKKAAVISQFNLSQN